MRALVVTNLYPTPAAPTSGIFIAEQVVSLRGAGVEVEVLHLDRDQLGRNVYLGLAKVVRASVGANNPSLVHVQYGGVMADIVTSAIRECPVLITFYGTDLLGGRGAGILDTFSRRYGVFASRRAAARATGVIVVSRNLLDAVRRPTDTSRVWILPNGVDLSRFRPIDRSECRRTLGWDPRRSHVLFPAAPVRPEKRYALAEASVELLNQSGATVQLHVLHGVHRDDVPLWLNAADAVLLTSAHEGSPNVVKEALACNVPVVSVDVGDVRERINGIDGCAIVDDTPEDIAANLGQILAREHAVDGRSRLTELSLERVAEKLRTIYETLTGAGP